MVLNHPDFDDSSRNTLGFRPVLVPFPYPPTHSFLLRKVSKMQMRLLILERITHRYSGWRWKQKTKNILYCTSGVDFCQRFAKVVTARSTSFNFCLSKCHHNDQHDITIAQWATCSSKTTIKIFLKMIFNIIGSHCNIICEYCTSYSKMTFKKKKLHTYSTPNSVRWIKCLCTLSCTALYLNKTRSPEAVKPQLYFHPCVSIAHCSLK